jgi:hypothetical protein
MKILPLLLLCLCSACALFQSPGKKVKITSLDAQGRTVEQEVEVGDLMGQLANQGAQGTKWADVGLGGAVASGIHLLASFFGEKKRSSRKRADIWGAIEALQGKTNGSSNGNGHATPAPAGASSSA